MTESNEVKKRVTCKRPHPNQHVYELLESLYEEAVKKQSNNAEDLELAMSSIEKYPLPLSSGADCAILKGFDTDLCIYIDLHLNNRSSIKKSKVHEHHHEKPQPVKSVEVPSDTEIPTASKRNRKKKKQLVINTNKCSFNSEFGKPSTSKSSIADADTCSVNGTDSNLKSTSRNLTLINNTEIHEVSHGETNNEQALNIEKNNNTKKSDCKDETCTGAAAAAAAVAKAVEVSATAKVAAAARVAEVAVAAKAAGVAVAAKEAEVTASVKVAEVAAEAKVADVVAAAKAAAAVAGAAAATKESATAEAAAAKVATAAEATLAAAVAVVPCAENKILNANPVAITDELPPPYSAQMNCQNDTNFRHWGSLVPFRSSHANNQNKIMSYNKEEVIVLDDSSTTENSLSCSSSDDECIGSDMARQPERYFHPIRNMQPALNNQPANIQRCPNFNQPSTSNSLYPTQIQQSPSNAQEPTNNSQESTSSDDSQSGCSHNDNIINCQTCQSIKSVVNEFEKYYRNKLKEDAEEIGSYVLPHKFYKPAYRSGAYAILVALLEQRNECPFRDCLTKDELIQKAQKHTDQSFTSPKPQSNCSAWIYAKRLITKGLIKSKCFENRGEVFYMLTVMGRLVATELVKQNSREVTLNDVIFQGQRNDRVPGPQEEVVFIPPPTLTSVNEDTSSVFIEMPPGTFEIVMLIDKREHLNSSVPASPNNFSRYELRHLNIGDFLWVARSKKTGQELVLPYVVERKVLDDFCSSIQDGRYHEQKFRLRKCGLHTVMYIVENNKDNKPPTMPITTIAQAMNNMIIQDEFFVVRTISTDHTFRFLGLISEHLVHEYLPKFLLGCNRDTQGRELMTFDFFNKFSCKNKPLTVKDTFVKMLLQQKGLSVEKALAITERYNTPHALMKAYECCTEKEGELLLARLKFNNFTRNVGPVVSKTIYKLFSKLEI